MHCERFYVREREIEAETETERQTETEKEAEAEAGTEETDRETETERGGAASFDDKHLSTRQTPWRSLVVIKHLTTRMMFAKTRARPLRSLIY